METKYYKGDKYCRPFWYAAFYHGNGKGVSTYIGRTKQEAEANRSYRLAEKSKSEQDAISL